MKKFGFKYLVVAVLAIFIASACEQGSILDSKFNIDVYNKMVSLKLYNSKEIDHHDCFLLNYTIKRQKPLYGYEVKGKTYREILEMAREFQANGIPVKTTFNYNGKTPKLTQMIRDVEPSTAYKKGSKKKLKKTLNFSCKYTNTSNSEIALQTSTFQVYGPFNDHVCSLGYESNCLMRPKESITINYIVDVKELVNNLRFQEVYYVNSMGLDDFINSVDIVPSGNSITTKAYGYDKCKFGGSRIPPFKIWDYFNDVDVQKIARKNEQGQVVELLLGDAHYIINDQQEIQNMKRIGKGAVK